MKYSNSIDVGSVTGIASLILASLMFCGISARTIINLPWKKIGLQISKGAKFTGFMLGAGVIVGLGMVAGLFVLGGAQILWDSISAQLEITIFGPWTNAIVYGVVLVVFLLLLGYFLDKSGRLFVKVTPHNKK